MGIELIIFVILIIAITAIGIGYFAKKKKHGK